LPFFFIDPLPYPSSFLDPPSYPPPRRGEGMLLRVWLRDSSTPHLGRPAFRAVDVVHGRPLGHELLVLGEADAHVADPVSLAHEHRLRAERAREPRGLEVVHAQVHRGDGLPRGEGGPRGHAPG